MQAHSQEEIEMKRFHVHVAVDSLQDNIRFYSSVFGTPPTVAKDDYAKWMLDDPRVNFAISTRGAKAGLDHLGLQVDSDAELKGMKQNLIAAQAPLLEENEKDCCYAKSDKYWITDPQGIAWETFRTLGTVPVYGESRPVKRESTAACCAPSRG
jgi:catechol 2,3-dioxygenase-like lactoylglutathione lyase family enzyme